MTWKRAFLITSASLGLGFGLASTAPVAHACKCTTHSVWVLELESIDDVSEAGITGDLEREQAFWPAEANFSGISMTADGHYLAVAKRGP